MWKKLVERLRAVDGRPRAVFDKLRALDPWQRAVLAGLTLLVVGAGLVLLFAGSDDDDRSRIEAADASTSSSTTPLSAPPPSLPEATSSSTSAPGSTVTTGEGTTGGPETTTAGSAPPTTGSPAKGLAEARIRLTELASLDRPVAAVVRPGSSDLWIAERPGRVRVLRNGAVSAPVVDISSDTTTDGERGLLGLAISPNGSFLYLSYTNTSGDSRVDEFAIAVTGSVDGLSRRNVLSVDQPFANHNGGHVVFGPDGRLYVGFGDGGSSGDPDGHGQNTDTLLGSILRIDPRPSGGSAYGVPSGNPFVGRAGRDEIFLYGLRNPWRFSFDSSKGDLWIGDVGQNAIEEIDLLRAGSIAGANLGWNRFEGSRRFSDTPAPGAIGPVYEYSQGPGCSVTGGVVAHDRRIPALEGVYLFSDFCDGTIRGLRMEGGSVAEQRGLGVDGGSVASFATDAQGRVLVLSLDGPIYRIDPA